MKYLPPNAKSVQSLSDVEKNNAIIAARTVRAKLRPNFIFHAVNAMPGEYGSKNVPFAEKYQGEWVVLILHLEDFFVLEEFNTVVPLECIETFEVHTCKISTN